MMKLLDEVIENPFDPVRFGKFIAALFLGRDSADICGIFQEAAHVSDFSIIKRSICSEGSPVAILAMNCGQDSSSDRNGYLQIKTAAEIMAVLRCDAALTAFYDDGVQEWKLSYIRLIHNSSIPHEGRDKKACRTLSTSFILGGCGRREASVLTAVAADTARKRLMGLLRKKGRISLKDIDKAFNYKAFTKKLIKIVDEQYPDFLGFPEIVKLPDFRMRESRPYERILSIDPEMLGNIFESRFDKKERKSRGAFYTPSEIVSFMCRESLAQYISNAADLPYEDCRAFLEIEEYAGDTGALIPGEPDSGLKETVLDNLRKIDDALRDVRIFDPAAGSGAFVLGMLREIVRARVCVSNCTCGGFCTNGNQKEPPSAKDEVSYEWPYRHPYILTLHTLRNCIFAADTDEKALAVARLRLWCALASTYEREPAELPKSPEELIESPAELPKSPDRAELEFLLEQIRLSFMDEAAAVPAKAGTELFSHLKCGNSLGDSLKLFGDDPLLAEVIAARGGFDMVVGNPPYISAVEDAKYGDYLRHSLRNRYPILRGSFDIYTAFLLEGVRQTNEKGIYCWIIPNSLLTSHYAAPVLSYLKDNGLWRSISVSDFDIFHNTGVYPVIVIGNKKMRGEGYGEYTAASIACPDCAVAKESPEYKSCGVFKDYGLRFASGTAGFQAKAITACISEERGEGAIPFAVSGSIDKYSLDLNNVRYMGKTYARAFITKSSDIAQSKWRLWCGEKIVIAGLARELEADYCGEPLALGVGAYALYDFGGYDPMFILGLLNSRFMSEYLNIQFHERHLGGGYLTVNKAMLEQLPFVPADPEQERIIAGKAVEVRSLIRRLRREEGIDGELQQSELQKPGIQQSELRQSEQQKPGIQQSELRQSEQQQIKGRIDRLRREIDTLVDSLYSQSIRTDE